MADGNWQTEFDLAERLHRSVLAEVEYGQEKIVLTVLLWLGW